MLVAITAIYLVAGLAIRERVWPGSRGRCRARHTPTSPSRVF